jgi:hypothetical protein
MAIRATLSSSPKSTILEIVPATADETIAISTSPTKFMIAAIMMADPGLMQRDPTTVAIALGASVAPFTSITPIVKIVMIIKTGFVIIASKNSPNSIGIEPLSVLRFGLFAVAISLTHFVFFGGNICKQTKRQAFTKGILD